MGNEGDGSGASGVCDQRDHASTHDPTPVGWGSRLLVLVITAHLFLVWVSLGSSVGPSQLTSGVLAVGHSYLQATHFGVDGRPVYLSKGGSDEQPLRLELNGVPLLPETFSGAGSDDRQQRWLSTLQLLVNQEQPSLAAELLTGLLRREVGGQSLVGKRIVRQLQNESAVVQLVRTPTILSSVLDDQEPLVYQARIIFEDDEISLVRLLPERLTAVSESGGSR